MQEIEEALVQARSLLSGGITDKAAGDVLAILTGIGSQIGSLQVECCTQARMPLYAETLERLTKTQLSINLELGRAH